MADIRTHVPQLISLGANFWADGTRWITDVQLRNRPCMDKDLLKNYWPVSSLPLLSKVVEKVVTGQLLQHLDRQNMLEPLQSAHRKHHLMEMFCWVFAPKSTLHWITDRSPCLIVLLDLSSAFDTIGHRILLNRRCKRFGLCGIVHQWMTLYLQDRSQRVVIGRASSEPRILIAGVPHGSVLGPLLFSLCSP